jgi:D-apionolactonase
MSPVGDPGARLDLRAGPMRCVLQEGALRWITLVLPEGGEREVVRGVYAAVRDRNWGTPAPRFTRYEVEARDESFSVRFTAEHIAGEIDLVWDGEIDGGENGAISFSMDARARSTFFRNRLGFCVLHPMEMAGEEVEVEHSDGSREVGTFPEEISPHQPFFDIAALRQEFSGAKVEIRFEGDVFEMEDQRNWTDASYKTYCTPLGLPYPVEVTAGMRIQQRIVIQTSGDAALPRPLAVDAGLLPAQRGTASPEPPAELDDSDRRGSRRLAPGRPEGSLQHGLARGHGGSPGGQTRPPAVGLQRATHGREFSEREVELLRRVRPAHLWVTLELTRPEWEQRLRHAAAEAARLGCPLEIEAVCGDAGAGIDGLAARLAADGTPVSAVHVYPKTGVVTTEVVAKRAQEVFRAAQLRVPVGGGSRADFVNVNRATLPLQHMDFLAFAINPQVHTFDDASIFETLGAQTVVLDNARRIAGGRPVRVGPITLRQRLNPAATGSEPPPEPDPRQRTGFCAEWTRRSIDALSGAAALTFYETTGPLGLLDGDEVFPVFHALAAR